VEQFGIGDFWEGVSSGFVGSCWGGMRCVCGEFGWFVLLLRIADYLYPRGYIRGMTKTTGRERRMRDQAFAELQEDMNPRYAIRRRMIEARIRAGLTQAQLARRMGTTQPAIARLEAGRRSPNLKMLERLAEATWSRLVVRLEDQMAPDRRA
jgi:DNA-binding XRE family transcriptional regulator